MVVRAWQDFIQRETQHCIYHCQVTDVDSLASRESESSNSEIGASGDSHGCSFQLEEDKESDLEVAVSVGGSFDYKRFLAVNQRKAFLI